MNRPGIVFLVGAGPGDPGLITVRGVECLRKAEVIVYDYLANRKLLEYAPAGAERIYAGKIGGRHNQDQEEINRLLVEKARGGKTVVRLKGGDPFVFGRGGEECEALQKAGITFEVVPGVTAAVGAAAYAGIPLTHRDYTASAAFVTGQEGESKEESNIDWQRLAAGSGTVVFYMGVFNLRHNMQKMIEHGRPADTPVALVRWGTLPEQRVLVGTLADIADSVERNGFKPPAVTIVGEVVKLRKQLQWYDNRPLSGRNIMVTRSADQAGEFSSMLSEAGALVVECPTIRIIPPEDFTELDIAINQIAAFDWLILTSVNAVKYFFERVEFLGKDVRVLGSCRIAVVGPQTALALRSHGLRADLVPHDYKAEGIIEEFQKMGISGKKILFPKADLARDIIPQELERLGATCITPMCYRNIQPESMPEEAVQTLEKQELDCITFTSSSTVINLSKMIGERSLPDLLSGVTIASIGPITSKTCRELGLKVDIEPEKYTLAALTDAICKYFSVASTPTRK